MFTYEEFKAKIGADEAREEFAEFFECEDFQAFSEIEKITAIRLMVSMFVDEAKRLGLDIGVEIMPREYEQET